MTKAIRKNLLLRLVDRVDFMMDCLMEIPKKVPHALRGLYLESQVFGRAKDLWTTRNGDDLSSNECVDRIGACIY